MPDHNTCVPSLLDRVFGATGQCSGIDVSVSGVRGRSRLADDELIKRDAVRGNLEDRGLGPCRGRSIQQACASDILRRPLIVELDVILVNGKCQKFENDLNEGGGEGLRTQSIKLPTDL